MKFTPASVIILLFFAQQIYAASQMFSILSLHSASSVHFLFLNEDSDRLVFRSGNSLSASITNDGKLKFTNGKYAVAQDDGTFKTGSESEGSTGFAISDSHITFLGSGSFYAIPDGPVFAMSTKNATNGISIVASPRSTKNGQAINNFVPNNLPLTTTRNHTVSQITSRNISSAISVLPLSSTTEQVTHSINEQTRNDAKRPIIDFKINSFIIFLSLFL